MIQIDVAVHTDHNGQDGLIIPAGSVIDVIPSHPSHRLYDEEGVCNGIQHDIAFQCILYKSLDDFEAGGEPITNDLIREFNIAYIEADVDPSTLTSLNVQTFLKNHIENGGGGYPGIGANNSQIVYPSWV